MDINGIPTISTQSDWTFLAGVSKAMKKKAPFTNIGGTTKWSNGVKKG